MNKIGYYISKFQYKILKKHEIISNFYRRGGVKVGKNCVICGYMSIGEPFLVEIRDNCVISSNVNFITHDHSINKVILNKSNLFGKIIVGNNCFVGQGSILLYGVELADNIIVASGSVVTKSFPDRNIIIGGNPAKVIGTWDKFAEKYADKAANRDELPNIIVGDLEYKLVRR
ncbi:MAG TPA: acyltransferase [Lachnospiraceae bacterium]|nr:acyltransferase [Lachnospiraceae bacterium]